MYLQSCAAAAVMPQQSKVLLYMAHLSYMTGPSPSEILMKRSVIPAFLLCNKHAEASSDIKFACRSNFYRRFCSLVVITAQKLSLSLGEHCQANQAASTFPSPKQFHHELLTLMAGVALQGMQHCSSWQLGQKPLPQIARKQCLCMPKMLPRKQEHQCSSFMQT